MERLELIGNLGSEPAVRTTQSGKTVVSFTLAVNRRVRNENVVRWYQIEAWEKTGELCAKFLSKGKKVYVSGYPRADAWKDKASGEAKGAIVLTVDRIEFLTPRGTEGAGSEQTDAQSGFTQVTDDELPF